MALNGGGGGGGSAGAVRAGRAFVELFSEDSKLRRGLAAARERLTRFAKTPVNVGLTLAGAGFGVAGLAKIVTGVFDAIGDTAKIADAGKALGTTAEGASGLFGALGMVGGELKENIEGITQFGAKVRDAFNGVGEEPKKLFEGLAVSAADLIKLPIEEQFYRVVDAINQLEPTLRASKLQMLGGTDSFKQWLRLADMAPGELRGMADATRMTAAEMAAATAASRAYTAAVGAVETVWRKVASAVAPAVAEVAGAVSEILGPVSQMVSQNRGLVAVLVGVTAGVMVAGLAVAGFGAAAILVSSAISGALAAGGAVAAFFGAIPIAVTATVAAVAALAAAAALASSAVRGAVLTAFKAVAAYLRDVTADARSAWGGVVAAVGAGDLQLAAKIAFAEIRVEWVKLTTWMGKRWRDALGDFGGGFLSGMFGWVNVAERVGRHADGVMAGVFGGAAAAAGGGADADPDLIEARAELGRLIAEAKAKAKAAGAGGVKRDSSDVSAGGPLPGSVKSVQGAFDARSFAGVFGGASEGKVMVGELKSLNARAAEVTEQFKALLKGVVPLVFKP